MRANGGQGRYPWSVDFRETFPSKFKGPAHAAVGYGSTIIGLPYANDKQFFARLA